MRKFLIYMTFAVAAVSGCITNDLPYPVVVPHITDITVAEAQKIDIDHDNRNVVVYFPETFDLRQVYIDDVSFDNDNVTSSIDIVGIHDLTSPLSFTLSLYEDFDWTITAVREIERYFTVSGQVGSSVIDHVNHRAVAMVGKNTLIDNLKVTSLKLGPEDKTVYSLDISEMTDFTHGVSVDVTFFGVTETWHLYVEATDMNIEIKNINPWAHEAYVTLFGISGVENGFRYRQKGNDEWEDVSDDAITADGGSFVAHITGLEPQTIYEVQGFSGQEQTVVEEFITESALPLPNGSFEYASKVYGKEYYKFYDPDCGVEDGISMFWGSGNGEGSEGVNGSANMGIVITYVDTDVKVDGKQSVRAQTSQLAGILAAGNLFTGQFAGLVGTSGGKVNFGRPWSVRPKALKLYCRYSTGRMDIINGMPVGVTLTKEDYDCAEIKFAIGNWNYKTYGGTPSSPVHVNTTDPGTFINYDTDPSTIANGSLVIHHDGYAVNGAAKVECDTDTWIEYLIPLNFHDMDAMPTHIIISCAASRYGDYFSGCSSSKLWLDDFELIYE